MPIGVANNGTYWRRGGRKIIPEDKEDIDMDVMEHTVENQIEVTTEGDRVVSETSYVSSDYANYTFKNAQDFAIAVINNKVPGEKVCLEYRIKMAIALLPYTTQKREIMSRLGKKEKRLEDAKNMVEHGLIPTLAPVGTTINHSMESNDFTTVNPPIETDELEAAE